MNDKRRPGDKNPEINRREIDHIDITEHATANFAGTYEGLRAHLAKLFAFMRQGRAKKRAMAEWEASRPNRDK
jgi:hypothetical protein